jgi:hypothetical protein
MGLSLGFHPAVTSACTVRAPSVRTCAGTPLGFHLPARAERFQDLPEGVASLQTTSAFLLLG